MHGERVPPPSQRVAGARLEGRDGLGNSALVLAAKGEGDPALLRWLRDGGVPVDDPDVSGRTALAWAAQLRDEATVAELLALGGDPARSEQRGKQPLHDAAAAGKLDVMRRLLDGGAPLDAADRHGDTPLMVACARGRTDGAALLIERGARLDLRDQEGRTPAERDRTADRVCAPKAG